MIIVGTVVALVSAIGLYAWMERPDPVEREVARFRRAMQALARGSR